MDAAALDTALADTHRAFVDTSTCIAYFSTAEAAHPVAAHLFNRIADEDDPMIAYLSVVSVSEMLVRPIRAGQARLGLVSQFIQTYPNLQILPANFDVAL
jgi:predicted nucleic acid-binding protein